VAATPTPAATCSGVYLQHSSHGQLLSLLVLVLHGSCCSHANPVKDPHVHKDATIHIYVNTPVSLHTVPAARMCMPAAHCLILLLALYACQTYAWSRQTPTRPPIPPCSLCMHQYCPRPSQRAHVCARMQVRHQQQLHPCGLSLPPPPHTHTLPPTVSQPRGARNGLPHLSAPGIAWTQARD
jgi:hypothetical protein